MAWFGRRGTTHKQRPRQNGTSVGSQRILPREPEWKRWGSFTAAPPVFQLRASFALEVELQDQLDRAVTIEVIGVTEVRIGCDLTLRVKVQLQSGSRAGWIESRQRMVQEVVGRSAELELLRFGDLERLKQRQVVVDERRTFDVGEHKRPVVADRGSRKTRAVNVLTLSEILARIARQHRLDTDIRTSGDSR